MSSTTGSNAFDEDSLSEMSTAIDTSISVATKAFSRLDISDRVVNFSDPHVKILRTSQSSWRPKSKTGVGRLTYKLSQSPPLHVVAIDTWTRHDDNTYNKVFSQKLRFMALQDLVDQVVQQVKTDLSNDNLDAIQTELQHFKKNLGFRFGGGLNMSGDDGKGLKSVPPFDHLIVNLNGLQRTGAKILERLGTNENFTTSVKRLEKGSHTADTEHPRGSFVECSIVRQGDELSLVEGKHRTEQDRDLYRESLDILFRTYVSRSIKTSRSGDHNAQPDNEVLDSSSYNSEYEAGSSFGGLEPFASKGDSWLSPRFRIQPNIERKGTQLALHLDIDLAYQAKEALNCVELLHEYFGEQCLNTGLGHDNPTQNRIGQLLCGLRVSLKYQPFTTGDNGDMEESLFWKKGDKVIIKEVKASKDINVQLRGRDGLKLYSSVVEFLKMEQLQHIAYPNLPLANIARLSSHGPAFWVPLELLDTAQVDFLPRCGHLTAGLKLIHQMGRGSTKLTYDQKCYDMCQTFVAHGQNALGNYGDPEFISVVPAERAEQQAAVKKTGDAGASDHRGNRENARTMLVVHVPVMDDQDKELIDREFKDRNIVRQPVRHISVRSVQNIMNNSHVDKKFADADVLLCVIRTTKSRQWGQEDMDRVEADLHQYGEMTLGAVTICVKKEYLDRQLEKENLFRKMNFMLGNTNFESTPLVNENDVDVEPIMYVGAQVSRPNSRMTPLTPSIASVVASNTREPVFFPGSARLQSTIMNTTDTTQAGKTIVREDIQQLRPMVAERFRAWTDRNGFKSPPTSVVFFRKGLTKIDHDIIMKELHLIEDAYIDVFKPKIESAYPDKTKLTTQSRSSNNPSVVVGNQSSNSHKKITRPRTDLKIAYILCGSNTKIFRSMPEGPISKDRDWTMLRPFTFTTAKNDYDAKILYNVFVNDLGLDADQYKTLTGKLNISSQLTSKMQVSVALPLHYSQKLAHRMLMYLRHMHTNDLLTSTDKTVNVHFSNYSGRMRNLLKNYKESLSDQDYEVDKVATKSQDGHKPGSPSPWHHDLRDKMFYL